MTPAQLEALYTRALRLYPAIFHQAYAEPMRQSFHDALADSTIPRRILIPLAIRDLITSLLKEHTAMLRETYSRPALLFNAFVLAGMATVLALALYAIPQQLLRNGANDPQIQLANDASAQMETGAAAAASVPAARIDMARSLAPFVIAYDDQGRPLASQAKLNDSIPAPPAGVLDYVRTHGEERVSWQPARGVRIAAVVVRVHGPQPGFVLAGRSMREVEARTSQVRQMAGVAWVGMLTLIILGTAIFGWITRAKPAPIAA